MGLCSFKFFQRRRTEALLQAAILAGDVTTVETWSRENSSLPRDFVIGEHGEPPVLLAVMQACKAGPEEGERAIATLKALLKMGFSPDTPCRDAVGVTPVYTACRQGRNDILQLLLAKGAAHSAPTLQGQTPIVMAAALGFPNCVETLLQAGADPNTLTLALCGTALHLTAPSGHPSSFEICKLLLNYGADINKPNRALRTPLHCACETKRDVTDMIRFIVQNGADINAQDLRGNTPLMRSMAVGNVFTGLCLVELGANITIRNNEGKTARNIAESKKGMPQEAVERIFGKNSLQTLL